MVPRGYYAILYCLPEGDDIGVRFPEHPNINTCGTDWKHAEEMAQEVLSLVLEVDFEHGFKLPKARKPKAKRGERVIFVPIEPEIRIAYLLRALREDAGLTQKQVANKLGIKYQSYQRMERPGKSNLSLATLSRVAKVLKRKLVIEIQ